MRSVVVSACISAVVAFGVAAISAPKRVAPTPRVSFESSPGQKLISMMSGAAPRKVGYRQSTASSTGVCINFQNGDDPAVNAGDLWELRHLSCSGPDCLIMMMRPFYELIEDHPQLPSSGIMAYDPEVDGTWTFSWQTLWTTMTGDPHPLTNGFSAYTCRLGKSFPNYYGAAAKGGVKGAAAGAYQFTLSQPLGEWCHLDYCSQFNKLP